jgi:PspA/IM30 family
MERKVQDAQAAVDDWRRRAELALRAGEEDLAREALRRKKAFQVGMVCLHSVQGLGSATWQDSTPGTFNVGSQ